MLFSRDKESNISDIFPADRKFAPISGFSPKVEAARIFFHSI